MAAVVVANQPMLSTAVPVVMATIMVLMVLMLQLLADLPVLVAVVL